MKKKQKEDEKRQKEDDIKRKEEEKRKRENQKDEEKRIKEDQKEEEKRKKEELKEDEKKQAAYMKAKQEKQKNLPKKREFKIAIVGSGGVGKSCMTLYYIKGVFQSEYDPTIEDSYVKEVMLDGIKRKLTVQDTAGQEEYRSMLEATIQDTDGFIMVYSIASEESLEELYPLLERLKKKKGNRIPLILAGNKSDLQNDRKISSEMGRRAATKMGALFVETSAFLGDNIEKCFMMAVRHTDNYYTDEDFNLAPATN